MPVAYSVDLRAKIVEAYNDGEGTQQELAERFKVSVSTVTSYVKIWKEKGDLSASKTKRGPQPKITDEHQAILESIVRQNKDALLREYCELFEEKTGISSSVPSMCRALQRFGLVRKKNSTSRRTGQRRR